MATNTILQYLDSTASDGSSYGVSASNRRQIQKFIAAEAITANDLVSLDLSQSADGDKGLFIVKADVGTGTDSCAIGFALDSATAAGEEVRVTIAGIHENANVAAATAAGSPLCVGSTAGRAAVYTASVLYPVIAIAAEDDSAVTNQATVCVLKQF
jgi:hypothetical protein